MVKKFVKLGITLPKVKKYLIAKFKLPTPTTISSDFNDT